MNTSVRCGILIPAYEPDDKLIGLVEKLLSLPMEVVVIDDGSTHGDHIFAAVEQKGATVLHHRTNYGKGKALKTGLSHMYQNGFTAAVTADADGQHSPQDIRRIAEAMGGRPGQLILGMRNVLQMPAKSTVGNRMTRRLFSLLYGIRITDTQTGLRGIPLTEETVQGLMSLPGERYEYEMEMLIYSRRLFPAGIHEVPIETIYVENNAASHFRPLRDGARVWGSLFRHLPMFLISSLIAFALDYSLFNLLYYLLMGGLTLPATFVSRIVSGTTNYLLNRRFVFRTAGGSYNAWNYLKLAGCILAVNSALIYLLVDLLAFPAFAAKLIVETVLYLFSFVIQSKLASKGPDATPKEGQS